MTWILTIGALCLMGNLSFADGTCILESNSLDFEYVGKMKPGHKVKSMGVDYRVTKASADGGGSVNYELSPVSPESDTAPFWVTCGEDVVD